MSTLRILFLALPASAFLATFPLAATTRIDDPVAFVRGVYAHFVGAQGRGPVYDAPQDIYTPRLSKLLEDDRKKTPAGDEGCLDFVFWLNGQDWKLTKIEVTEAMATSFCGRNAPRQKGLGFAATAALVCVAGNSR